MDDLISRQAAIKAIDDLPNCYNGYSDTYDKAYIIGVLEELPSAQPEQLKDDDFETIRVCINAFKEKLCNQRRWEEAREYQRILDRFIAFATVQPERKRGKWMPDTTCAYEMRFVCSECKESEAVPTIGFTKYKPIWNFCPNCGADMRGTDE